MEVGLGQAQHPQCGAARCLGIFLTAGRHTIQVISGLYLLGTHPCCQGPCLTGMRVGQAHRYAGTQVRCECTSV